MQVIKKLDNHRGLISLFVQVHLDDEEAQIAQRFGFYSFRISTKDGAFVGKDSIPRNQRTAYRVQLGRVKNRWSSGVVRTTGLVLLDTVLTTVGLIVKVPRGLAKLVVGRRKTLSNATNGISVKSRRIEVIKEAELFIFVSLAAVAKALEYARSFGEQRSFQQLEFLDEVQGLDFAGAGHEIESEFEAVNTLYNWSKIHT